MLIVTTFEIPGYTIDAVLGEVMGMTVRSANIGANFVASFKAIGGGEISEYTNLVYDSRNQVMQRMWEQCVQRGGNAIVAMRFDTGDIGQAFSEVCAYGTAVVVHPIATEEEGGTPQSIAQANALQPAPIPSQSFPAPAPVQQANPQPTGQPQDFQPPAGYANPQQAGQPQDFQPPAGYTSPSYR